MMNTPPNDVRNFVHKRLFGAAKGLVTGGPTGALSGFFQVPGGGSRRRVSRPVSRAVVRRPTSRTLTARPDATSAAQKARGLDLKFPGVVSSSFDQGVEHGCAGILWVKTDTGCRNVATGEERPRDNGHNGGGGGGGVAITPIGDTVMGRYGAGEVPGSRMIDRAICRRGMVLGNDGICYNRSQISNREREWPRGRRPLLTGGDMRAISTAARAGKRLEGATKRLQKIGLMKKPASRRSIAARHHAT